MTTYPLRLLLPLLILPVFSLAQGNYKPGYIVRLNGDTVKGYVDYKAWGSNPSSASFKKEISGEVESISPATVNAFAVRGFEYYNSYTVHITTAQVDMINIKQGIDTSYITSKVFLKVLTSGVNCTLFSYKDDIKTRYYILEKGSTQPYELIYRQYYRPDDVTFVMNDNTYRIQLRTLTQKYNISEPKLITNIESAQYVDMELINIVQKINGNSSRQFTPKSTAGIRWFAGLSAIYNYAKLSGDLYYPSGNATTTTNGSVFPAIDGGFDIILNKQTQSLFFRVEVAATADQHSYVEPADAGGNSYNVNNVRQYTGSISPQIFYNFINSKSLRVYINGGFCANISAYNSYQFNQTFSNVKATPIDEYPQFSHFWVSYPVKAGVFINDKLELYVGYVPAAQINFYNVYFTDKVTQYQAGVNFMFGK